MKKCPKCSRVREDQAFYPKKRTDGTIGLRSYCKDCGQTERDAWRTANKAWDDSRNNKYNKRNAVRIKAHKLTKYWPGSSPEQAMNEWQALFDAQQGLCAFGHKTNKLHVDHCHTTGKVRGLLCYNCNNGIGRLKDDVDLLYKVIAYLNKHRRHSETA